MSKRYTFWRTPEGHPCKRKDERYAPKALLAEFGKIAKINDKGQVQWTGFDYTHYETAIRSLIAVVSPNGAEMDSREAWLSIVRPALVSVIRELGGGKPIEPLKALAASDEKASEYFRRIVSDYVFVTSMSIKKFPASSIMVNGCNIAPIKSRGQRYPLPSSLEWQTGRGFIGKHLERSDYQLLRIKVKGRSQSEAADNALDSISLLRGYWNLFATFGGWSMSIGQQSIKPLGVIHLGPAHTLHHPDGKLVDDIHWYDPTFVEEAKPYVPKSGDWSKIEKNRKWSMRHVARYPYQKDLESLLIRYAAAMDQRELSVAFLMLWAILERITGVVGRDYDELIRRATSVYRDRAIAKEIMRALRVRRNRYVHASHGGDDPDQLAYAVKRLVDEHFYYLINNRFRVSSLDEYGEHLSLSTNLDTLLKTRGRLNRAIEIQKQMQSGQTGKENKS